MLSECREMYLLLQMQTSPIANGKPDNCFVYVWKMDHSWALNVSISESNCGSRKSVRVKNRQVYLLLSFYRKTFTPFSATFVLRIRRNGYL